MGDVAKVGKVKKDVKIIEGAIDAVNKGKKALHFGGRTFYSSQKLAKYKELANHYGGKVADAIWDSGKGGSNKLAKALKTPKGQQAHHVIPRELIEENEMVRDAINQGFDFNSVLNGISLDKTQHFGSHPNYTNYVRGVLETFKNDKKYSNALEKVKAAAGKIMNDIKANPGKIDNLGK